MGPTSVVHESEAGLVTALNAEELQERVLALTDGAQVRGARASGPMRWILMGGVLLAAAGGAAFVVLRRRGAAADEATSGESQWGVRPVAADSDFVPGVADEQSPDVVDGELAHEIDEVADEVAGEFIDSIELPGDDSFRHVSEAPQPVAEIAEPAAEPAADPVEPGKDPGAGA